MSGFDPKMTKEEGFALLEACSAWDRVYQGMTEPII